MHKAELHVAFSLYLLVTCSNTCIRFYFPKYKIRLNHHDPAQAVNKDCHDGLCSCFFMLAPTLHESKIFPLA